MAGWSRRRLMEVAAMLLAPVLPLAAQTGLASARRRKAVRTAEDDWDWRTDPSIPELIEGPPPPEGAAQWEMVTGPELRAWAKAVKAGKITGSESDMYNWFMEHRGRRASR